MRIVIRGGEASAVYSDASLGLLEALGRVEIRRASEVEWDDARGEWVARSGGEEIASGRSRRQVVEDEVRILEERL